MFIKVDLLTEQRSVLLVLLVSHRAPLHGSGDLLSLPDLYERRGPDHHKGGEKRHGDVFRSPVDRADNVNNSPQHGRNYQLLHVVTQVVEIKANAIA